MARISTYPVDGTITSDDKLLGSNGDDTDKTVSFNIDDIKAYINSGEGGAGVSSIVAGTNVTISPSGGTGAVTINSASGAVSSIVAGQGITTSSSTGNVTVSLSNLGPLILTPTPLTVSPGQTIVIDGGYEDVSMFKLSWSGATGTMVIDLPSAAANLNRVIRFVSDSTFTGSNHKVHITPAGGNRLDGSTTYYEINKDYEGVQVWSDGTEWFIIQKKA